MTGAEIIEEIKRLPIEERAKVLAFTRSVTDDAPISPEALGERPTEWLKPVTPPKQSS